MSILALDGITLDVELQPRAEIDRVVLENYMQLLVDGTKFPPVTVFRDGATLWLADGFHRWHAHNALEFSDIDAVVHDGTRRDALLYSLSANADHGLQRGPTDYKRAYEIACRNGLVNPTDSEAVAVLLRCSGRWGTTLTERAREAAKAARDAEIIRLKAEGLSNREVAKETDVSRQTVDNIVGGQKRKASEIGHPGQEPVTSWMDNHPNHEDEAPHLSPPPQSTARPEWAKKLDELETPGARNWSSALKALRSINEQASVDVLFDDRFVGFDQVLGPELDRAFAWINQLHRRFGDGQVTRRRA